MPATATTLPTTTTDDPNTEPWNDNGMKIDGQFSNWPKKWQRFTYKEKVWGKVSGAYLGQISGTKVCSCIITV